MKNADTFEMNKNWTALCTSQAGDANQEQHSLAKFMMECTIGIQGIRCILPCLWEFIYPWSPTGEYDLAHQPPSLVAAASLLLSLKLTNAPAVTFDWFLIHVSPSPGNLFSTVDQQSGVLLHLHMHWPGMIIGQCMALCVGYFIWLKGHFQDLSRFQLWSAWLRLWWNRRKLGQWLQQWPGGFVKCSPCDWVWPGSTRPRSWGK